jgi:hypothetical protein
MGMQPIPRPPLGHNPRRPEEKDLDDATEHAHRAREASGRRPVGRLRRLLDVLRPRPKG